MGEWTSQMARRFDEAREAHERYLACLRAVAGEVGRGGGGRECSLAITEAEASGHRLRDATWAAVGMRERALVIVADGVAYAE